MLFGLLIRHATAQTIGMQLAGGKDTAREHDIAVAALGGVLLHQWAVLGAQDLLEIADFPTLEAATAFKMVVGAAGSTVEVLALGDVERLDDARDLAARAAQTVIEGYGSTPAVSSE